MIVKNNDIINYLALFRQNAEIIPGGKTCNALSQAAKSNQIYLVGGSIPEVCDNKIYNTCTVWSPEGNLIAKHRKVTSIRIYLNCKIFARDRRIDIGFYVFDEFW